MPAVIYNVSTNIISGFLGVGKTTAILNLFTQKPDVEKWAVLVNEFGKTGIDGKIYQANGIAVKEIPGGCMCCAQGLPLQVAVNRLLRETNPDRLIIESSGVGHPAGVLNTLKGEGFNNVLSLKAGICLLDPEHLISPDYQDNELFKEQIQFADVLVANKTDLASAEALQTFKQISQSLNQRKSHIASTTNGMLNSDWLDYEHQSQPQDFSFTSISSTRSSMQSSNWQTHCFQYPENTLFDIEALKQCLSTISVLRLKGLIQSKNGCCLINYSSDQLMITALYDLDAHQKNNYIEVIDVNLNVTLLEKKFTGCVIDQPKHQKNN